MFFSIAAKYPYAVDLSYVLYKHPDRMFEKNSPKMRVLGFYPEYGIDRSEFCLVVEVDTIERVRGVDWAGGISAYVDPMPYTASSYMSQALVQSLRSAMNGIVSSSDEATMKRLSVISCEKWPLEVKVGPLKARSSLIKLFFEPLGWSVEIEPVLSSNSDSRILDDMEVCVLKLRGDLLVSDALSQMYVLLPALSPDRHYFYNDSEVEKLIDKGGDWLKNHPFSHMIIRNYLKKSGKLVDDAFEAFGFLDSGFDASLYPGRADNNKLASPHRLRHQKIVEQIRSWNSRTVLDLGCGEGRLLSSLAHLHENMNVVGIEPSPIELDKARSALAIHGKVDPRIKLVHGTPMFPDCGLSNADACVLSEVIEHIDEDRLYLLENGVFGELTPSRVIVTTPNGDYNAYFGLRKGELRHRDHRFEWSISEMNEWCQRVCARYPYTYVLEMAGGRADDAPESLGEISHYAVFTRKASE